MLTKISNKNMHIPSIFTHKSTVMQYLSLMKKWVFDITSYYEAYFYKKKFFLHKLPETSPSKNIYNLYTHSYDKKH